MAQWINMAHLCLLWISARLSPVTMWIAEVYLEEASLSLGPESPSTPFAGELPFCRESRSHDAQSGNRS